MVFLSNPEPVGAGETLAVSQARDLGTWYGKEGSDGLPYGPYGPAHALILVPAFKMGTFVTKTFDVPAEGAVFVWGAAVVSLSRSAGRAGDGVVSWPAWPAGSFPSCCAFGCPWESLSRHHFGPTQGPFSRRFGLRCSSWQQHRRWNTAPGQERSTWGR